MLRKTILFDLCHNEMVNFEEDEYSEFLNLLKRMDFKIKKNDSDVLTKKGLQNIDILVIGNPIDDFFSNIEIRDVCEFVRTGGNLILVSEYGADYLQKTNMNDLSGMHFGIFFEKNLIKEINTSDQKASSLIHVNKFESHPILSGLRDLIIGGACSIYLNKNAKALLKTSNKSVWSEIYNSSTEKWEKEKEGEHLIAAYSEYGQGKIVAIGDVDIFTNDTSIGITAYDNAKYIQNILKWIIEPVKEEKVISNIFTQIGDLQNKLKELTKTVNNIIETISILEKRISFLERKELNNNLKE